MRSEDFSAWVSAIGGLSAQQRREALQALEAANREERDLATGDLAQVPAKEGGKRREGRKDALGTTSHERVEAQGCPHCAGREVVGWGRSYGLLRFRCKACGRTFNALTKTPMAHLRKKDRWLDHARAMIEGKSLAKTAALCGVHPTTAFRWRHRFLRAPASDKPRSLRGIVEADETFILESFKSRWSDPSRKARKRGGTARHAGLYQDNMPILVARDRKGATFDAVLPQVDGASVGAALADVVTPGNHLIGDGGKAIAAFARRAGIPFHAVPAPGKPTPEAPQPAHQQRQRLPRTPQATAQPLQRRRHQDLPNYLGWRRALEAWGGQLAPPNWIKGAIGKRTIPTGNAIKAGFLFRFVATIKKSCLWQTIELTLFGLFGFAWTAGLIRRTMAPPVALASGGCGPDPIRRPRPLRFAPTDAAPMKPP
jgi:transposase-like protein